MKFLGKSLPFACLFTALNYLSPVANVTTLAPLFQIICKNTK